MCYIYQADLYCDDCGRVIADRLAVTGYPDTENSDDFPQFHAEGGGEADSPQHCAAGETCTHAITLRQLDPATGKRKTYRIASCLENDLTDEGAGYVRAVYRARQGLCWKLWRTLYPEVF